MDIVWEELTAGLPDTKQLLHVLIRLIADSLLGAVVGFQGKERVTAGLRTHMLVSVGSCLYKGLLGSRDVFGGSIESNPGHHYRNRMVFDLYTLGGIDGIFLGTDKLGTRT